MDKTFLDAMEYDILNADIPEAEKNKLIKNFLKLKSQKINLMITGATGCGKSSTINALFNTEVAKVGVGVDPETMEITKYELDNLILWDSPGLGDGKEADSRHAKNIIKKLNECDAEGNLLIDLVLVLLDGSTRDLGTSYDLINSVIIPNLGNNKKDRILVAINQADVAMKGRYWDYEHNKPEPPLVKFLDEKTVSVQRRIKEGTGVDVSPIYYSAGFKEEGVAQSRPYNLSKLLYFIIKFTPKEKRLSYFENINQSEEVWKDSDDLKDYKKGIIESFGETMSDCAIKGAGKSTTLNSFFQKSVAKVSDGVDPETMDLDSYALNDFFRLWDTPGLGDGVEKDNIHKKKLVDLLYMTYTLDNTAYGFIDMALVIIEGANRDMGTTYTLLNEVIVPNIQSERIFVAINQADVAMKGRHWNHNTNTPDMQLKSFLDEQASSIMRRVKEATGVNICTPIAYSAEYGYNVLKLFDFIIDNMPVQRRSLIR